MFLNNGQFFGLTSGLKAKSEEVSDNWGYPWKIFPSITFIIPQRRPWETHMQVQEVVYWYDNVLCYLADGKENGYLCRFSAANIFAQISGLQMGRLIPEGLENAKLE